MPVACYSPVVSAIQVKNVPAALHDELRRRAEETGRTVGELVLEAIRRDLRRRSTSDWIAGLGDVPRGGRWPTREQVHAAWGEVRAERR